METVERRRAGEEDETKNEYKKKKGISDVEENDDLEPQSSKATKPRQPSQSSCSSSSSFQYFRSFSCLCLMGWDRWRAFFFVLSASFSTFVGGSIIQVHRQGYIYGGFQDGEEERMEIFVIILLHYSFVGFLDFAWTDEEGRKVTN